MAAVITADDERPGRECNWICVQAAVMVEKEVTEFFEAPL